MKVTKTAVIESDPVYIAHYLQRVSFQPIKVGESAEVRIPLHNSNDKTVVLTVYSKSEHFKVSPATLKIPPNKQKELIITFKPKSEGTWAGIIIVEQDGVKNAISVVGKATR